jgi:hypothetical protein
MWPLRKIQSVQNEVSMCMHVTCSEVALAVASAVALSAQADGVASAAALRCLKTGSGNSDSSSIQDCIRGLQYDPAAAWQAAQAWSIDIGNALQLQHYYGCGGFQLRCNDAFCWWHAAHGAVLSVMNKLGLCTVLG